MRYVLALALLFPFTIPVWSQGGTPAATCVAEAAGPRSLRPRGTAELVSDVVISCSHVDGGAAALVTLAVRTNAAITSRIVGANNAVEALLLVDDPAVQVGQPAGSNVPGANVFQGTLTSVDTVTFGPFLFNPPGVGQTRKLRVVNVRVNSGFLATGAQVFLSVGAGDTQPLLINNPTNVVGMVAEELGFEALAANGGAFGGIIVNGCTGRAEPAAAGAAPDFLLRFSERFASAFRRRNIGTTAGSPEGIAAQAVPGTAYPVESGSESGFFNPDFPATGGMNQAGLATQGTRLMARFVNVPAGTTIWVTVQKSGVGSSGGVSARLVQTDDSGAGIYAAIPEVANGYAKVTLHGGTGVAVWEILGADAAAMESVSFGVVVAVPENVTNGGTISVRGAYGPLTTVGAAPSYVDTASTLAVVAVSPCLVSLGITSACPLPSATAGTAYSTTLKAAGGKAPYAWSIVNGALPVALSLAGASGVVSGTAQTPGTYGFTAEVTDSAGAAFDQQCSIDVLPPVTITTACPLAAAPLGVSYNQPLAATGGLAPYTWSIAGGGLPAGINVATSGSVIGIAGQSGTFALTLKAVDAQGAVGTKACSLEAGDVLQALPAVLHFRARSGGTAPPSQIVNVTDTAPGQLFSVTSMVLGEGNWLTVTPSTGQIPAYLEVSVDTTDVAPGVHNGSITILTQGTVRQSIGVGVVFDVDAPVSPQPAAEPASISVAVPHGASRLFRSVSLVNRGFSQFSFSAALEVLSGQNWVSVSASAGTVSANQPARIGVTLEPSSLDAGTYRARIHIRDSQGKALLDIPVTLAVSAGSDAMRLSQSGVGFVGLEGGSAPTQKAVYVLASGAGGVNWNASAKVDAGLPAWLSVSPRDGGAAPGAPSKLNIGVETAGLAAGHYTGEIRVTADGVDNSPRVVLVALDVRAGGSAAAVMEPSGLVFVGTQGGANPPAQTIVVRNPGGATFALAAQLVGNSRIWSMTLPADLSVPAGESRSISVKANPGEVAAGVYKATLVVQAGAGNPVKVANLVLLAGPVGAAREAGAEPRSATPVCPPGGLQIVPVSPGINFQVSDSSPAAVEMRVFEQSGKPFSSGTVTASFTGAATGDRALAYVASDAGLWSGTLFPPSQSDPSIAIRVVAEDPSRGVSGCIEIPGTVVSSGAPVIPDGGAVSPASFVGGNPISPGGMVAIFGTGLAEGANAAQVLPLPTVLGSTRATIAGQAVPLFYAGDLGTYSQVNGVLPYSLTPNVQQQLIVRRGSQAAYAEIVLAAAMPGVFTVDQSGSGAAVAVHGENPLLLVSAENPASAGEVIVIYAEGLGAVESPVTAGSAVAATPLPRAVLPVKVTIGGTEAELLYAGLTPGLTGLYQLNVKVPGGVAGGAATPVSVRVGGQESAVVTIAVR